jgi:hypothetical protein
MRGAKDRSRPRSSPRTSGLPERITDWHWTINCRLEIRGPRGHQCNGGDCPTASGSVAPLVRDLPKGQVLDGFPVNGLMCSVYSNVVTFGVPSTAAGSSCGWIGFKMDCVHGSTRLTSSGVSRCVGNLDIPDGCPKRAWRSVRPRSADAPQPARLMPIKSEQKNRFGIVTAWQ